MAKKVSVTSVTPAIKVKATSKAEQARTRNLVMGIASATPVGRVAKTAATAAKAAAKVAGKKAVEKRIPATYTPTKKAVPVKVVNKTTPPINKNAQTDAILEELFAKSLKATKATGGDPKKIKVTYNGRTIDYKGIR